MRLAGKYTLWLLAGKCCIHRVTNVDETGTRCCETWTRCNDRSVFIGRESSSIHLLLAGCYKRRRVLARCLTTHTYSATLVNLLTPLSQYPFLIRRAMKMFIFTRLRNLPQLRSLSSIKRRRGDEKECSDSSVTDDDDEVFSYSILSV